MQHSITTRVGMNAIIRDLLHSFIHWLFSPLFSIRLTSCTVSHLSLCWYFVLIFLPFPSFFFWSACSPSRLVCSSRLIDGRVREAPHQRPPTGRPDFVGTCWPSGRSQRNRLNEILSPKCEAPKHAHTHTKKSTRDDEPFSARNELLVVKRAR